MKGEYYVDSNGNECFDTEKMEKEEFERVMAEHRLWLSDHEKGKRAYLRDTDLSEMDLSGMDFSYADMCGINLFRSNLTGTNLSHADLKQGFLHDADLTGAIVEKADFFGANLTMAKLDKCAGSEARFAFSRMWGCQIKSAELKKAFYFGAQVCDCDFSGSDLEAANFSTADLDNSVFVDTNLKDADFFDADRTYWCDFENADMTGVKVYGIDLNPENLKGVKGLHMPLYCPEEGSFVAWKKCREGKVVKLLVPEHAGRKGNTLHTCRATEVVVLDIYDTNGLPVEEAVPIDYRPKVEAEIDNIHYTRKLYKDDENTVVKVAYGTIDWRR